MIKKFWLCIFFLGFFVYDKPIYNYNLIQIIIEQIRGKTKDLNSFVPAPRVQRPRAVQQSPTKP